MTAIIQTQGRFMNLFRSSIRFFLSFCFSCYFKEMLRQSESLVFSQAGTVWHSCAALPTRGFTMTCSRRKTLVSRTPGVLNDVQVHNLHWIYGPFITFSLCSNRGVALFQRRSSVCNTTWFPPCLPGDTEHWYFRFGLWRHDAQEK